LSPPLTPIPFPYTTLFRSVNGLLRQGHRVGTHVGDVAAFVEILGDRHGALGGEAELATCFLLQGRGTEGGVRAAGVRLGLHLGEDRKSTRLKSSHVEISDA